MQRELFHNYLDTLAEIWYIDAGPRLIEPQDMIDRDKRLRRTKMRIHISTEDLKLALDQSESNPSGYPVVERWKHQYKPEIINIRKVSAKYF